MPLSHALRISSFLAAFLMSVPFSALAQEAAPQAFNPQCVEVGKGKKIDITLLEGSHIGGGGEPKKLHFSIPEAYVYRSASGPEVTSFSARIDWDSMIPYCFHYMPIAPKSLISDMAASKGELLLRYSLILLQEPFTEPAKYQDYIYKNEVARYKREAGKDSFGYPVLAVKEPEVVVDANGVESKFDNTIHLVPGGVFGARPSYLTCRLPVGQKVPETCHVQFFRDNLIIDTDVKWEWLGEDPKGFYDAVMQFTVSNIVNPEGAAPVAAPKAAEEVAPEAAPEVAAPAEEAPKAE